MGVGGARGGRTVIGGENATSEHEKKNSHADK